MSTDPAPHWPEGYDLIALESCDSTNAEGLRRVPELVRPTWIFSRAQTGARGRQGRPWAMPPGSFAATLMMRPTGTAGWAALRSFMAANALFETLTHYVARGRLSLKWPNDVLLDGGKLAGILLETRGGAGGVDWLAIGIGVNLGTAPEMRDAAFSPVALDPAPDPRAVLDRLAGYYATQESILERLGFEPIREKWLRHAARLGEIVTARTPRGEITGRFVTLDEGGRLVLDTAHGERRIAAADIHFPTG
ncbi:biotin--[acetyl-CoA-carboxylase] ligase [Palleronia sediminis]|uniref:biotin--[biotin carboxyl-carrier protein] ligase n=1 Tax=Palleronia sediminis TaxID=2547833 RepID=A0A4R6AJS1_9RHOB|nr:biotin--[acetyl-CoA-carboxylase] ligase [Palleronia sediminis]TDL84230.1 biotin--[acetyl-CoA-carboxylase] ligase [Palleronia sediminis]